MELSSPEAVAARLRRIDEPHVAPLSDLVRGLRAATGQAVPWFDPLDGGTGARLLVLMEAPSRKGIENGFVSVDNPTPTGRRMRAEFAAAGLPRETRAIWNVVPWYLGDATRARNPTPSERRAGTLRLGELLTRLPNLAVVLTLGAAAREGWRALDSDLPQIAAPHPSNTNLCARPWALEDFRGALREAARLVPSDEIRSFHPELIPEAHPRLHGSP